MKDSTLAEQRQLHRMARAVIERHYRSPLTLPVLARALASSPRQLQRAYLAFGGSTFREDLLEVRMTVAAQLLVEQPAVPVATVARLVGYRHASHFARAFRGRYGLSPARYRRLCLRHRGGASIRGGTSVRDGASIRGGG